MTMEAILEGFKEGTMGQGAQMGFGKWEKQENGFFPKVCGMSACLTAFWL